MNDPAQDSMSFDDARTRVMHMVSELCSDEQCVVVASLDRCVTDAVSTRWSNPVKTFVPLFAYRGCGGASNRATALANLQAPPG
ncbi:hypothetical protein BH24CHL3_BH24CHL3_10660 [soil metagenome]